jgi:hypothetical protein
MRKLLTIMVLVLGGFGAAQDSRAQACPGVAPWVFDDVLASDTFCSYITWMAQEGVSLGCSIIDANHRLYCPDTNVTRKQMSAFMFRLGEALLPSTCGPGQVLKWNGTAWACANDDTGGIGTVTSVAAGTGLVGSPNPIVGAGSLNLAPSYQLPQACSANQIPKWNGSDWVCAADSNAGGTVTSVATGQGLTGGPVTGSGTINLAATQLLPVVACATGQLSIWNGSAWSCSNTGSFSGNIELANTTSATVGNITKAGTRFIHNYGLNNTFVGIDAGNFTATGAGNTGIGRNALQSNSTGSQNVAIGDSALVTNTAGDQNTAIGTGALLFNTTGGGNTAAGSAALFNNTTGYSNSAHGVETLFANTTGQENTALGRRALFANTTGRDNTATGFLALGANLTGAYNTAAGAYAMESNSSGGNNTATGAFSLQANSTGANNAAYGYRSLYTSVSGDDNTAAGFHSLSANTTGSANTATGKFALLSNVGGFGNTATGYASLGTNVSGNYNTGVGYGTDTIGAGLTNATAIGAFAVVDASNHVRIGDVSVTQIGGQVAWSNLSDRRGKKDITDSSLGLDFVRALHPVEFKLLNGNDRIDIGFIAQEVEAVLGTRYNMLGIGTTPERKLSLRYTDFIAPLVKAIQEQQHLIEAQQARLAQQDLAIAALRTGQSAEIAELRRAVEVLLARTATTERVAQAK